MVQLLALDSLPLVNVSLIKLDVQGAEKLAVYGARVGGGLGARVGGRTVAASPYADVATLWELVYSLCHGMKQGQGFSS